MTDFEQKILNELSQIKDRLNQLERQTMWNQPFGPIDQKPFMPIVTNPPVIKCSTCGIKLEGVMGYCCPRGDCPTGMGPVMC